MDKRVIISIHAPREGGDRKIRSVANTIGNISIHAPREGGDVIDYMMVLVISIFQSTPPARGATEELRQQLNMVLISIHAPREGGDNRPHKP